LIGGLLVSVPFARAATQTYVLPVVVTGVPGLNGSYWQSELRIVDATRDHVVVRRKWVALAEGGFVDDPPIAPTWEMPVEAGPPIFRPPRIFVLSGRELLAGTNATHGAVAIEIDKDVDAVLLLIANTAASTDGDPYACCLSGNGQLVTAYVDPPYYRAEFPWSSAGGGLFRTNVGLVNPNDRESTLRVTVAGYSRFQTTPDDYWRDMETGSFEVTLPPFGWLQVNDILRSKLGDICPKGCYWLPDSTGPLLVQVSTVGLDDLAPFYAYVSSIHTPTNDPLFIPGYQ